MITQIPRLDMEDMEANLASVLGKQYLDLRKATRPRRYFVPGGMADPARLALSIESHFFVAVVKHSGNVIEMNVADKYALFCSAVLMRDGMPTYFVDRGILDAVLRTEAPENMLIGDIKWPRKAATFYLPLGAIRSPGENQFLTCVSYAFVETKVAIRVPMLPALDVSAAQPDMSFALSGMATTSSGETYSFYIPCTLDMDLGGFMAFASSGPFSYADSVDEVKHLPEDADYNQFLMSLALRLVMVMAARPNLVEMGERKKPARMRKDGKPEAELWSPNWIGYRYQAQREKGHSTGGHKAIHWRVGHWRNQAHGPQHSLRKLLWIEPVLIGE